MFTCFKIETAHVILNKSALGVLFCNAAKQTDTTQSGHFLRLHLCHNYYIYWVFTTALPDGMWQYSISLDFSSNYRRPSCLMCGRGASGLLSFTFTFNCPGNFIASCFIIEVLLRRLKKVKDLVLYTCLFLSQQGYKCNSHLAKVHKL